MVLFAHFIRKLGKLADALPPELGDAFILFSKTGTFSSEEIALAKTLNSKRRRVILWSREELEPYYPYERSKEKLGDRWLRSGTPTELANNTHSLFFQEAPTAATVPSGGLPALPSGETVQKS
jgi:hypothetical protein